MKSFYICAGIDYLSKHCRKKEAKVRHFNASVDNKVKTLQYKERFCLFVLTLSLRYFDNSLSVLVASTTCQCSSSILDEDPSS